MPIGCAAALRLVRVSHAVPPALYGQGTFWKLLQGLQKSALETALFEVYRRSLDELYQDWTQSLS